MAEFLVMVKNKTNSNSDKDKSGCYKAGDLVQAMPDGHQWGKKERLPIFIRIKVPGMSVSSGAEYTHWVSEEKEISSTWNLLTYEEAVKNNDFDRFIRPPVVSRQKNKNKTITVNTGNWAELLWNNSYFPFYDKPIETQINATTTSLRGEIKEVVLDGVVLKRAVRRRHHLDLNAYPFKVSGIQMGEVSLTKDEFIGLLKDKTKE